MRFLYFYIFSIISSSSSFFQLFLLCPSLLVKVCFPIWLFIPGFFLQSLSSFSVVIFMDGHMDSGAISFFLLSPFSVDDISSCLLVLVYQSAGLCSVLGLNFISLSNRLGPNITLLSQLLGKRRRQDLPSNMKRCIEMLSVVLASSVITKGLNFIWPQWLQKGKDLYVTSSLIIMYFTAGSDNHVVYTHGKYVSLK